MFLKEFFEKVNFEKSQQTTTKEWKIIQHAKSVNGGTLSERQLCIHYSLVAAAALGLVPTVNDVAAHNTLFTSFKDQLVFA